MTLYLWGCLFHSSSPCLRHLTSCGGMSLLAHFRQFWPAANSQLWHSNTTGTILRLSLHDLLSELIWSLEFSKKTVSFSRVSLAGIKLNERGGEELKSGHILKQECQTGKFEQIYKSGRILKQECQTGDIWTNLKMEEMSLLKEILQAVGIYCNCQKKI